jgi:hypothetical protein
MKTLLHPRHGLLLALLTGAAPAKLPAPSDEAKAKAAETAAKTAHGGKVEAFLLCKSMDKVAAGYQRAAKKAGKPVAADRHAGLRRPRPLRLHPGARRSPGGSPSGTPGAAATGRTGAPAAAKK